MNKIPEKQNSEKQIQRLAAQRELYSSAKRFHNFEVLGSIAVPALATLTAIVWPSITYYAAIYGLCFYVLDTLIVEPEIKKRRAKATKIQELFDCDSFDLPRSDFRTVSDVTVEDVLSSHDAHAKIETNVEKLKNWYPPVVGKLPLPVGRLVCQRLNYCWDSRLRKAYATVLRVLNIAIALMVFVSFAVGRLDGSYLPLAFTGLLPFFRFSVKQFQDNQESSEKLALLNNHFENLWASILNHSQDKDLLTIARRIQDEIYDNRLKNPLIPDAFFWFYRNRDESLMQRTAETLVGDYEQSAGGNTVTANPQP